MARRDQPYLPLFVKDFLSDEKLKECSAESHGIFINLMCVMHLSHDYGTILLKQKYKQNSKQIINFALQLEKQMPFSAEIIERSLAELVAENVVQIDGDSLSQKRMVKDGKVSDVRASAGSKGGKGSKSNGKFANGFASGFAQAKSKANTEIEIEYINETENENNSDNESEDSGDKKGGIVKPSARMEEIRKIVQFLNTSAGTKYKPTAQSTQRHINARLDEGYTLKDFIAVIKKKAAEWKCTDFAKYLRPETLFGGKFEGYLNQPDKAPAQTAKSAVNVYAELAEEARAEERLDSGVIEVDTS